MSADPDGKAIVLRGVVNGTEYRDTLSSRIEGTVRADLVGESRGRATAPNNVTISRVYCDRSPLQVAPATDPSVIGLY